MTEEIDFVAEHPKADMSKVNTIIVNGKEYVSVDRVLEFIDETIADYEAVPTEIDVGREKAVMSFEKKDGMLAMASMIKILVLGLKGKKK